MHALTYELQVLNSDVKLHHNLWILNFSLCVFLQSASASFCASASCIRWLGVMWEKESSKEPGEGERVTFCCRFSLLTAVVVGATLKLWSPLVLLSHTGTKPDCGGSFMDLAVRWTSLNKVFIELPPSKHRGKINTILCRHCRVKLFFFNMLSLMVNTGM